MGPRSFGGGSRATVASGMRRRNGRQRPRTGSAPGSAPDGRVWNIPARLDVAADRERAAIVRFVSLMTDELNVKAIRYVSEAEELGRWELKPNYRALGPRFGKHMPQVAAAVVDFDESGRVIRRLVPRGAAFESPDGPDDGGSSDRSSRRGRSILSTGACTPSELT